MQRRQLANTIRVLSMDAVQKAHSGHPGMPMGMADIAEVLWNDFLKHNPGNPNWLNRDRFVVSNGHGCMLLYALLHLTGYALSIDDLKQFRQLHSKTPGHPEHGETPGVETTTGPLGQGLANAVGMAIAERHLAAEFNRPDFPLIDHYTYALVGDGCLMEGISHEACSLAGTLGLGKLIVFYDDNQISIDGDVRGWFTDNTPLRFQSYNWQVIADVDGHDPEAVRSAILEAQSDSERPTLICCKTVIGWGSPNKAGTAKVHGEALGEEEVALVRERLNWSYPPFVVPEEIYAAWDARQSGQKAEEEWQTLYARYANTYPELAAELMRRKAGQLPDDWASRAAFWVQKVNQQAESIATRKASQQCIQYFASLLPELMGGSADLTGSNLTNWPTMGVFSKSTPDGQYIYYGVREFAMSAIMNGIALYGGLIPFAGTFLTFSDYARNAVRLAALMRQKVIFVYTHDSIGLGEDGPTHQPIEHAPSLRMIPNLSLWRPCDTVETAVAWDAALTYQGPTCLLLSRQNLGFQTRTEEMLNQVRRGGYILRDAETFPDLIMIATGSEVALAVLTAEKLTEAGHAVRVVSMPSTDVFLREDSAYQEHVLPRSVSKRLIIEAAASDGWYKFAGCHGKVLGLDRFGASAPAKAIFEECRLTVEHVLSVAKQMIALEITQTVKHQEKLIHEYTSCD